MKNVRGLYKSLIVVALALICGLIPIVFPGWASLLVRQGYYGYAISLNSGLTVTPNPVKQNQSVEVLVDIINNGGADFKGAFCAAYFDSGSRFIDYIEIKDNINLPVGQHYPTGLVFRSESVRANPGKYLIYVFYKEAGSVNWMGIPGGSFSNYADLTIESMYLHNISLNSKITVTPNPLKQNQAIDVQTDIINTGTGVFNGSFCAAYFDSEGKFIDYIEIKEKMSLPAGQHYTDGLTFHSDAFRGSEDEYLIGIFHKADGGNWIQTPSDQYLNPVIVRLEAQAIRYTVSGYVKNSDGSAIAGATVIFSNGGGSVTTNGSGYYSHSVESAWNGSVTPSMSGYTFTPSKRDYSNVISDKSDQNFTGAITKLTISGYIKDSNNKGISGVSVNFSGVGSASTDSSGYYTQSVNYDWSGTAVPGKSGYTFSPLKISYYNVASNLTNQNYTGISKAVPDIHVNPAQLFFTPPSGTDSITRVFSRSSAVRSISHPDNLFRDISWEHPELSEEQNELLNLFNSQDTTVDSRITEVNFNVLKTADMINLNLFQGIDYTVFRTRIEERGDADYTWYGDFQDGEHGNVIFVVQNDSLTGIIYADNDLFAVRSLGSGVHVILKQDSSKAPTDEHLPDDISEETALRGKRTAQSDSVEDGSVITVLVAYTESAARAAGNISSLIRLAVDEANQSYRNSKIPLRLHLVHSYQVNYTETGTTEDLNRFTYSTDTYMNEVHELRDRYQADICILLVNRGAYAGVAWLNVNTIPERGFGVVLQQYAAGYYTFAHEIGHIQGARHNPEADNNNYPFPYGHGYLNIAKGWRTIMSYDDRTKCPGGSCRRILYWSNPDVIYDGVSVGTASTHNNARVLKETASAIANFRVSESDQTLTIQNLGGAPLKIISVTTNQNWISVSGYPTTPFNIAEGSDQIIKVDVKWVMVNPGDEGIIEIKSDDPDEPSVTVRVTVMKMSQDEMPLLSVLPDIQEVSSSASTTALTVNNIGGGSMFWTAKPNAPWLSIIDGTSGMNSKTIVVSFDSNTGDERIGTITISAPDSIIASQDVKIIQAAGNVLKGDIDNNKTVDLQDAVLVLQILAGINTSGMALGADVDSDKKIGMAEVIYILQKVSELR